MGTSVSNFIGESYINIVGTFLNLNGEGPYNMNIKFKNTGQLVKLVSIVSSNNTEYWQLLIDNSEIITVEQEEFCLLSNEKYLSRTDTSNLELQYPFGDYENTFFKLGDIEFII